MTEPGRTEDPDRNPCGECDLCCRLLGNEALGNPPGPLCGHYDGGCAIYTDRPAPCRGFHCLWLKAERLPAAARLGAEWRPDKAGFMMYAEPSGMRTNVVVEPTNPGAWRRPPYADYMARLARRAAEGHELVVHVGETRTVVRPGETAERVVQALARPAKA